MIARRRLPLLAAPLLGAPLASLDARAQQGGGGEAWPARPVRILVAYPPGGSTDLLARALAERLQAAVPGSAFVVENRPGGAAVVGTQAAAGAAPDGHTLALGNNQTHAANAAMMRDLPYRPVEDFAASAGWRRCTTRWWCRRPRRPARWRSSRRAAAAAGG